MARFHEQYGYAIFWSLIWILGAGLLFWLLVALAGHELLPAAYSVHVLTVHSAVATAVDNLVAYVEKRLQWFGALATLATFVIGLVTGIRQAKRALPKRLAQFMNDQLAPVYRESEALVAAVANRSANVPHKEPLFRKDPLNLALNALGNPFRPRRLRSLDEAFKEVGEYIEITEKRLAALKDIRAHVRIFRGAARSAELADKKLTDGTSVEENIEADFAAGIHSDTTKPAALELRGLWRSRLGNLQGALQDFEVLQAQVRGSTSAIPRARAFRHRSDILMMQAAGANLGLLRQARRNLNVARRLFGDGRTLSPPESMECGHNRESYGEVLAALAALTGGNTQNARRAFNDALGHFQRLGAAGSRDCERVHQRISRL